MRLETSRLVLRHPTLADVPRLFEFLGDTEAMQHTHNDASLRQCRRRVAAHERRRRRDGCAPWTVVTKADAQIVGWGSLYRDPFDPGWGVEVGYSFDPGAWGNGYATELVAACMSLADDVLDLPVIHAFARPENVRSRRVLEKTGFKVVRYVPEMERLLYKRSRQGERLTTSVRPGLSAADPAPTTSRRVLGRLAGQLTVPRDFDAPLPSDVLDAFEGR